MLKKQGIMETKFVIVIMILMFCAVSVADVTDTDAYDWLKFDCDGATTGFTYDFRALQASDLVVIHYDTDTDTATTLTNVTDYTVSVTNNDFRNATGGTVTTVSTYGATIDLIITTQFTMTQPAQMTYRWRPATVEDALDKSRLIDRQLYRYMLRSLRGPEEDDPSIDMEFGNVATRKGYWLGFDSTTGAAFAGTPAATGISVSSFMATMNDDADAATARTTLEITSANLTGVINVKDPPYNAAGNGSDDDTTAIQAAIDAAAAASPVGTVYAPEGDYMISNITLPAAIKIRGSGQWTTTFKWISGSTGNMFEDEGNAAKIDLRYFTIHGDNGTGTGLNLGNNATQWGVDGWLDNIVVRDITNGFDLNGNVAYIGTILAQNCTGTSVRLRGVMNVVQQIAVVSVGSTITKGLHLTSFLDSIDNIHLEGDFINPLHIGGQQNYIKRYGLSVGESITITDAILIDAGKAQNRIGHIQINLEKSGSAVTNVVNDQNNGIQVTRISTIGSYDQNAGASDFSVLYSDDAEVIIPAQGSIRTVVMDNLTANRTVMLPQLPSGYPVITVINNSDVGNLFKVNINAHGNDIAKKVGGRVAGFPLWAQSSITLKGVDSNIASDKAWERIGGQNNSLFTKQVEVSSAEMKALATSPKELIPAPGADRFIEFVSAVLIYDSAATDYTVQADENMAIRYENGSGTIVSLTVESDGFIKEAASDGVRIVHPIATFQDTDVLASINKSLVLDNIGSGEWDDGTGTMTVIITWREHYNLGL